VIIMLLEPFDSYLGVCFFGGRSAKPYERKRRLLWSEAMKRGLGIDVLKCGHCGGWREVLKCITDPKVIDRILTHLGLKTELPEVAPARAPPGSELLFEY